jgi:hypothetical protein
MTKLENEQLRRVRKKSGRHTEAVTELKVQNENREQVTTMQKLESGLQSSLQN